MMRFSKRVGFLGVALLVPFSAATAQPNLAEDIDTPEIVSSMFECRDIAEDAERLACFDREVGRVYEAQESDDLVIADRTQVREARRGLFGLKLPNLGGIFGGGDDDEDEIREITSTITAVRAIANGRYIFTLEDGARWMQTETPQFGFYKAGDSIIIKKGAIGSYRAKVNRGRYLSVRRVN